MSGRIDVFFLEASQQATPLQPHSQQGVKHFKDIQYSPGLTYGEMFLQNEQEMSRYNLDEACVADHEARFRLYEEEARRMTGRRLPIPAYDHLLKLSHTFNLLDARGAVGVTERASKFATLRGLAREIAGLWLQRRAEQGFPLGDAAREQEERRGAVGEARAPSSAPSAPAPFLLEIGCEELPPEDLRAALQQLERNVARLLEELRLDHGALQVSGTPRRLVVRVDALAPAQRAQRLRSRGPPARVAFDTAGEPTPALLGFCKRAGVGVEQVSVDDGGYTWAETDLESRPATHVRWMLFGWTMRAVGTGTCSG